jgi:F0F1-type ATP synthase delta subunit
MSSTVDPRFLDRWVQTISEAIGNDEGRLDRWVGLISLAESLKHFRPLRSFSLDGRVSLTEKATLFQDFCAQTLGNHLPEKSEILIVPLLEGNLWEELSPLRERLEKSFDLRTAQVRVEILSAAALSGEEKERVLETVTRFVNGSEFRKGSGVASGTLSVRPTWTVRPSLLAGLEVRIGSRVWDASLSSRIRELEKQLLKSA